MSQETHGLRASSSSPLHRLQFSVDPPRSVSANSLRPSDISGQVRPIGRHGPSDKHLQANSPALSASNSMPFLRPSPPKSHQDPHPAIPRSTSNNSSRDTATPILASTTTTTYSPHVRNVPDVLDEATLDLSRIGKPSSAKSASPPVPSPQPNLSNSFAVPRSVPETHHRSNSTSITDPSQRPQVLRHAQSHGIMLERSPTGRSRQRSSPLEWDAKDTEALKNFDESSDPDARADQPPKSLDASNGSTNASSSRLQQSAASLKPPYYLNPATPQNLQDFLATTPDVTPPGSARLGTPSANSSSFTTPSVEAAPHERKDKTWKRVLGIKRR